MLSPSLSPSQLIILYKTEKEAEQAPLQNNLPGGSSPQKLGRGLQGLLRHFQIEVLTHRFTSKKVQLPHRTVLQERVSLCTNLQEMVQHRVLEDSCTSLVPRSPHPHGLLISSQTAEMVTPLRPWWFDQLSTHPDLHSGLYLPTVLGVSSQAQMKMALGWSLKLFPLRCSPGLTTKITSFGIEGLLWARSTKLSSPPALTSMQMRLCTPILTQAGELASQNSDFFQTAARPPYGHVGNARTLPWGFLRAFLGWITEPAERLALK